MDKLKRIMFSMISSVVLLMIFAASIGYATFLENSTSTEHAKDIVYNSTWFEVLLLLLIVNLCGSIFKYQLISNKKWSVLLFHIAFIFMLLGAAITRAFGEEGIMHIRNGETSNKISTNATALKIIAEYKGVKAEKSEEVNFSSTGSNSFSQSLEVGGKTIQIENELFVPNAMEALMPVEKGMPSVSIFVMSGAGQSADLTLFGDETSFAGDFKFAFSNQISAADIVFSVTDNTLYFKSAHVVSKTGMVASGMIDRKNAVEMPAGTLFKAEENTVYRVEKLVFMVKGFMASAQKTLMPAEANSSMSGMGGTGYDAIVCKVTDGTVTKKVNVFNYQGATTMPTVCDLNGVKVSINYGRLERELPFSITLNKFDLERYAGSMSPSSYASDIIVTDTEMKSVRPFRIYMNNILNYRGYRFFQSSYDQDEQGTVLSVNHDYWGTFVTYFGYLIMLVGMIMTLFNKNSRFQALVKLTNQIQNKRKFANTLLIVSLLTVGNSLFANPSVVTKEDHLQSANSLLVQDPAQGRIEPFITYCSDVLRKISKHDTYKGKSSVEVVLGMLVDQETWRNTPIIKIAHPELEKELNAVDGYVSYNQLFDMTQGGTYRLQSSVETIYQKTESARNRYEKEVLNVDERLNICTQVFDYKLFKLFPVKGDNTGKWTEVQINEMPKAQGGACPFDHKGGMMGGMGMDASGAEMMGSEMGAMGATHGVCARNDHSQMAVAEANPTQVLLEGYLDAVKNSMKSGDWSTASKQLEAIKTYQLANGGDNLPSESKINIEISYNRWNLFLNLAIFYGLFGCILLGLHFLCILKPIKIVEKILGWSSYPLIVLFAVYTFGMAARWYIAGHAPWSNGYESMLFVGWAASFAGLLFAKKSPIAFAVSSLLSAIALAVAGMSWMNPEITNLVPVLKSYWLIVHVAVITSSYGFLAMSAMLGFLNLVLMISRTKKNTTRISSSILEISYIIEMSLIVGLFLLTVGTFLGGVWANESWGRYWGWDAKETWALVSVLLYSAVLHLRLVPQTNNTFVLSSLSLVSFSSVIMTYLGVNYYLSGMHSYGQGTPPPLPMSLYVTIVVVLITIYFAYRAEFKKTKK